MNNDNTQRILVAEDEADVRNYFTVALRCHGYAADFAEDGQQTIAMIRQNGARYAACLIDFSDRQTIRQTLRQARSLGTTLPVVVVADAFSGVTEAELTNLGAAAVLWKPVSHDDLRRTLEDCIRPSEPGPTLIRDTGARSGAAGAWWKKMDAHLQHVGASDVPVLVQGETGVGKEVLARYLHSFSPRAKKTFLKVNCAALPTELVESELFGYERGAFTGAFKNNPGKFELAQGGTILLDEIGDMDFKLQAKLLQVLQDREFLRLGAAEPCRVDVRVIAATHCNLERAIEEGRFREDLYYRLNIITIQVPPLRERKDEILELAQSFLHKHATATEPVVEISSHLRDVMLMHDWPGNVRELENVMRKLLVLRRSDIVAEDLLIRARTNRRLAAAAAPERTVMPMAKPHPIQQETEWESEGTPAFAVVESPRWERVATAAAGAGFSGPGYDFAHDSVLPGTSHPPRPTAAAAVNPIAIEDAKRRSILDRVDEARREAETEAIVRALNSTLWNRKRAAEALNIDYKALLYKMKKLGIGERASRVAI